MFEQAMLREQFQALLHQEQQAERLYAELVAKLTDPHLRQQVQQLHRDEQRHVRLAERLLEIVE
jgi:rubrerythrin